MTVDAESDAPRQSAGRAAVERVRWFGGKVARALRRVADLFPFTPFGLGLVASAALGFFYFGKVKLDLILLIAGAAIVGSSALAFVVVTATAIALKIWFLRTTGPALDTEASVPIRSGHGMSSLWFLPLVQVKWTWVEPVAEVSMVREWFRLHELVAPVQRGLFDQVVRRVEIADSIGICRIVIHLREKRQMRVLPHVGKLRQMVIARSIASGDDIPSPAGTPDGDRADLRRYAPGDPVRFILWKVFARSRQTMVRTPEQAISPARRTLAYMVAGEGDEAAAGAARLAVETGSLGSEWVMGADGVDQEARDRVGAIELLTRSGRCPTSRQGRGLKSFLARNVGRAGARVIVFTPAQPGPWLDPVIAAAHAAGAGSRGTGGAHFEFVVAADGIERVAKRSWISRLFTANDQRAATGEIGGTPAVPTTLVAAVVERLSVLRSRVLIVDRRTGRHFSEGHQRALDAA